MLFAGWLVVLRINVDLAIFQPYLDLAAGDNQSLKIQALFARYLQMYIFVQDVSFDSFESVNYISWSFKIEGFIL